MQISSSFLADLAPAGRSTASTTRSDVRVVRSPGGACEYYLTVAPPSGALPHEAGAAYREVARLLRTVGATILQERLFASADAIGRCLESRADAYGDLDDGVPPTLLCTRVHDERTFVGVQVHAIAGIAKPKIVRRGDFAAARVFERDGYHYLAASGIRSPGHSTGPQQARDALESAEYLLAVAGASMRDVARTWFWMDDILAWYPSFNTVRTQFFKERGMMGHSHLMPASTGIGVRPAGARIALDLIAAWGKNGAIERFDASGHQRSAFEYGSAFARAARVETPGGVTVYCSGTAAIDAQGHTCFAGDAQRQVRMTVDNVIAVLRDLGCAPDDVLQAMAYCALPEAAEVFLSRYANELGWPLVTMEGIVCRPDLLFEVEVTASPTASRD